MRRSGRWQSRGSSVKGVKRAVRDCKKRNSQLPTTVARPTPNDVPQGACGLGQAADVGSWESAVRVERSHALDHHGDSLTDPDAHRRQAITLVLAVKRIDERGQQT